MNKYENHSVIPSIDIIPLQSSSGEKRKFQQMDSNRFRGQEGPNRNYRDEQILARVQNYLFENEDKVYIDVNDMADHLQRKYREYRNRKRSQFRILVRKAYDEITESVTKKSSSANWHDEEEEEVDIESDPDEDLVSTDLLKMYKKPGEKRNGNSSDKELIDISSDDDSLKNDEEVPVKRMRTDSVVTVGNKPSKKHSQNDNILEPEIQMTTIPDERPAVEKAPEKSAKKRKEKEVEKYFTSKKQEFSATVPEVKFTNVGGNTKALMNVCKSLLHVKNPQLCSHFGKSPPRGILLCGPPGCGKSLVAQAIAGELQMPLIKVAAPELIGGISGESESRIRDLFDQAVSLAPCVLFLDEIDAIAPPKATAQKEMEKRIVSQLLLSLDGLESKETDSKVLILGATSRPEALDPALRAPGRFDQEINLGIPDKEARAAILKVHTENMKLSKDIDLTKLAALTPGYVGADLVALITQAAMAAINRAFKVIKQKPAENASEKPDKVPTETEKPVEKSVDIDLSHDEVVITEPEVEIEKEKKNESEPTETEKPKEDKPEEVEVEGEKEKEKEKEKETEKEAPKEAEINEKPAESSKPDENNDDAVIIDEVTIEDATVSEQTTEKEDGTSKEPIVEEPDDSPPTETVEVPKSESDVEIEELTEMISWLHGDVKVTDEQLQTLCIEQEDFDSALEVVQPSAKREGFATVPDVTWNDIGSLQNIRDELYLSIIAPVKHFDQFKSLGLSCSTGVLLCGPPGCGKTLLAKAIANEAEINFISVKGPELLNMYVGESEKAVRQCFMRARNSSPCVIFFDEIDALCPKRTDGDSSSTSRVVNQMLTEMDGIGGRQGVFLMAASNRPDIIDPAVLRPGRLDKILYVGLPSASDRREILNALTKNGTRPKFAEDVKVDEIGNDVRCEGFTGADLAALVREAGVQALKELMISPAKEVEICMRHVNAALNKVKPSVREEDMEYYLKLKDKYSVDYVSNQDVPMDTPENVTPGTPCVEAMET